MEKKKYHNDSINDIIQLKKDLVKSCSYDKNTNINGGWGQSQIE